MNRVILDSNVLIAERDENDRWHKEAIKFLNEIKGKEVELVYLDCVVNEVITVLCRRFIQKKRSGDEISKMIDELETVFSQENLSFAYPLISEQWTAILEIIKKHRGSLSFHDALIALYAQKVPYFIHFQL